MDVVYIVRPGDNNEELMFSLRSLRNYRHDRVWIVGHKPDWVVGAEHVAGNHLKSAHSNVYDNVRIAANHPEISARFILMNDDFYFTKPIQRIPNWHRGDLQKHIDSCKPGWWKFSLHITATWLRKHGTPEPISYELHKPIVVDKQKMAETLEAAANVNPSNPPQWRSLYGNMWNLGGKQHADFKALKAGPLREPFHSTEDGAFRNYRGALRTMFPDRSPFEQ